MIKGLIMWTDEEITRILAEYDEYERELDAVIASKMRLHKVTAGWYQLSNNKDPLKYFGKRYDDDGQELLFSNLRKGREHDGENVTQWYADIRYSDGSGLKQYAGIWPTLTEAKREVVRSMARCEELPQMPQMKPRK
jgi:hypothetical protein